MKRAIPKREISPYELSLEKIKSAALSFDKNLSPGIEYQIMTVIEEDIKQRAKSDLKINLIKGMYELQRQYKELFTDYMLAKGRTDNEDYFDVITANPLSAYNKISELITLLSKTDL